MGCDTPDRCGVHQVDEGEVLSTSARQVSAVDVTVERTADEKGSAT